MKRREFFGVLGGAAFLRSTSAFAQQPRKTHRIGVLWHGANAEQEAIYLAALRQGLLDFGYVEGQNIVLEMRFPAEQYERFFVLAAELAQQSPDVLVSAAGIAAIPAIVQQRRSQLSPSTFPIRSDASWWPALTGPAET
jgi:putative tryptophan/tyrosine transport system substrate-binding protein